MRRRRRWTIGVVFFYLFAVLAVASARHGRLLAKNPVHAVLFLILTFFNAAGLFVLLGAEFLAMLLVIVYVGAVAVLFLFVVMMLDVDFAELKAGFIKNAPVGALVGGIVLAELVALVRLSRVDCRAPRRTSLADPGGWLGITNTRGLGQILYTKYVYFFQAAGLDPARRHDRRHRADAAASRRRQAPVVSALRSRADRRPRLRSSRSRAAARSSRQAGQSIRRQQNDHRSRTLSDGRGVPLHARHLRHLSQSQERHRHSDVDRADSARGQHQPRRVLALQRRPVGQVFALFVLTVAAAEAAIGLAIIVVYFRNRGSIAVEDINMMKG